MESYIRDHREQAAEELAVFTRCETLREAIQLAASCIRSDGKRHSHQRRIPRGSLARVGQVLLREVLGRHTSFAALHEHVDRTIRSVHMIGELTIYDVAHRIGAHLGLAPERVYLHCGTRVGARQLGLDWRRPTLAVAELPQEFHRLSPAEAEDCLCIYRDRLRVSAHHGGREVPAPQD